MNNERSDSSPPVELQPPGAGLPLFQAFALRHIMFPAFCLLTPWDKAIRLFMQEGERLTEYARTLPAEQLNIPVLIKAPIGIEDSSRNWSAAMVLEHLIEVGSRIATGVTELTNDRPVSVRADIAEVKPKGVGMDEIIPLYRAFLQDFQVRTTGLVGNREASATMPHPWFGELNARQWLCLAALHQIIHRQQMQRILVGLRQDS